MIARLLSLLFVAATAPGLGCKPASSGASPVRAGSLARFVAHLDLLYALDRSRLHVYETPPDSTPQLVYEVPVRADAETLFPHGRLLFVGTRQGAIVYSLEDPRRPEPIGVATHAYSCDPVVVEQGVAYVTLRSGTACRQGRNALLVFDVADPTRPRQIGELPLPRPGGLGVDGDVLFVADAEAGLLVLDVRDPSRPRELGRLPSLDPYDVIAADGLLFVSAADGVYQFAYGPQGLASPDALSRVPIREPTAPLSIAR